MGCAPWLCGLHFLDKLVKKHMAIEDVLARAAELTAISEQMLAEPRAEMTYQPPQQPNRYRGHAVETFDEMLKASEKRILMRIDAIEARFQSLWDGVGELADEAGKATGELEKKLRDEMRKEVESLRSELTLLRAETKASSPARRNKPTSRAPWNDNASLATN
jgi:hypothetical protein